MTRRVIGPFNRVEGDLEISLDVEQGVVRSAYVNAPLFRGFEQILHGKVPADAMVIVPRICGICSVAQSAAAARALALASGLTPPPNGRLAANLTQAAENAADHLTHFYLFFMPDFAHSAYAGRSWHTEIRSRFRAIEGTAAAQMLSARTAFMRVMGLLAGKWPHTLSLQPGGSSRALQMTEKIRLRRMLREFRDFLESTLYGDSLEAVAALSSFEKLSSWAAGSGGRGDFGAFLRIAEDLDLELLGRTDALMISFGVYAEETGLWFPSGVRDKTVAALDPSAISEDVSRARYHGDHPVLSPYQSAPGPQVDKADAYTWCKAPRMAGRVAETGALVRQAVAGHALALDIVQRSGSNVRNRVIGRLLELARLIPAMERWADALKPADPYCVDGRLPDEADVAGLVEAARGSLGHWLSIRGGRIANYQIIAPTTWNFSPRDAKGVPGVVEQALVGTPTGESGDVAPQVFHVVRSFDPCMVCTVH